MEILKLMPRFFEGLQITLALWAVTLLLSLPLAFPVAFLRSSKNRIVSTITKYYIDIMRGTPLLLQMCFIFFGLPEVGIVFPRFTTAILAFVINYTAYFAEIFRSGLKSIDKGQWEAGQMLGISKPVLFFKVILPQTIRTVIPAVTNEVTTLVKDTSLVYILGLGDLLRQGKIYANNLTSLMPFVVVGVIYFVVITIISKGCEKIEKSFSYF
ncbi:MAG: amino acid ABC transporter permease [Oscillospiraceae bacterium]|nr:amino acid ABC transporter permease [Oscillospiraceae bacterium]MBP1553386.1 amino acid ABC transporter permease [Oscillospiraceae bacterium]MBP1570655.1 amino acid ABC transporter permease [Oscillospiraceae bacterium]MBQ7283476.1 amino acid ABC transporter permease [Oscillospiraceae bacterium]